MYDCDILWDDMYLKKLAIHPATGRHWNNLCWNNCLISRPAWWITKLCEFWGLQWLHSFQLCARRGGTKSPNGNEVAMWSSQGRKDTNSIITTPNQKTNLSGCMLMQVQNQTCSHTLVHSSFVSVRNVIRQNPGPRKWICFGGNFMGAHQLKL